MFNKAHVITDPEAREQWAMGGDHHDRCAVCWRPWCLAGWLGFDKHHLVHGSNGRSDEPCNLLLLCNDHHRHYHFGGVFDPITGVRLPDLTFAMLLSCKAESSEWDAKRLAELYHRRLPDLERLPQYYLEARKRWRRSIAL